MEKNLKPCSEMTAEEYDNLIMVLEHILSQDGEFLDIVNDVYNTLCKVFYCESKREANDQLSNATLYHQRLNGSSTKQIMDTFERLTSCMYYARNLDFGDTGNEKENARRSAIKGYIVNMFTVTHAKYSERFKQTRINYAKANKPAHTIIAQTERFKQRKRKGSHHSSCYSRNYQPRDLKMRTNIGLTSDETSRIIDLYSLDDFDADEKE